MIMLKSTHENVVIELTDVIKEKNEEIARLSDRVVVERKVKCNLEHRICELSIKRTVAETKANEFEGWHNDTLCLYRDSQNELNIKSGELKEANRKIESLNKIVSGYQRLHEEDTKELKTLKTKMRSFAVDTYWAMMMQKERAKSGRIKGKKAKKIDEFIIDNVMDSIHK